MVNAHDVNIQLLKRKQERQRLLEQREERLRARKEREAKRESQIVEPKFDRFYAKLFAQSNDAPNEKRPKAKPKPSKEESPVSIPAKEVARPFLEAVKGTNAESRRQRKAKTRFLNARGQPNMRVLIDRLRRKIEKSRGESSI